MSPGTTLFELLVVLAVLTLTVGLAMPHLAGGLDGAGLRVAARDLAAELRQTRGQAMVRNTSLAVTLDLERRQYWSQRAGGRKRDLPQAAEVRFLTVSAERLSDQAAAVRFFPDGSATGGRITLSQAGHSEVLRINWLTGRVSRDD